jgi:uncharacterized protein
MSGLVINLATLPAGRSRLEVEASAASIGLPETEWAEPVRADLSLDRSGEQVTVRGDVRGTARLECVRCLRAFDLRVDVTVLVHADRAGTSRRAEQEELERDDYMRFHDGRQLDVGEDVREALLLEIPINPRCREDCQGLCPRCGGDRNEGACDCATTSRA